MARLFGRQTDNEHGFAALAAFSFLKCELQKPKSVVKRRAAQQEGQFVDTGANRLDPVSGIRFQP